MYNIFIILFSYEITSIRLKHTAPTFQPKLAKLQMFITFKLFFRANCSIVLSNYYMRK